MFTNNKWVRNQPTPAGQRRPPIGSSDFQPPRRLAKGADGMATCDLCETLALLAVNEMVQAPEAVFTFEAKANRPEAESIVQTRQSLARVIKRIRHAVWPEAESIV